MTTASAGADRTVPDLGPLANRREARHDDQLRPVPAPRRRRRPVRGLSAAVATATFQGTPAYVVIIEVAPEGNRLAFLDQATCAVLVKVDPANVARPRLIRRGRRRSSGTGREACPGPCPTNPPGTGPRSSPTRSSASSRPSARSHHPPGHHRRPRASIIGSGPAGCTAAIYAARANLAPVVIEGEPSSTSDQPGGQLMLTTDVENYPGFPDGIMGPELMETSAKQAERFGTEIHRERGRAWTSRAALQVSRCGDDLPRRAVIIATGASPLMARARRRGHRAPEPRRVDLRHLRRLLLQGTGDRCGRRRRLGDGGGALPHQVRRPRSRVVHRRDTLRASKIMQERAFANPKIEFRGTPS